MSHFLQYWKHYDSAHELGTALTFAASRQFVKRNVNAGDSIWPVACRNGRLILLGQLVVDRILPYNLAKAEIGESVYKKSWFALAKPGAAQTIVEIDIQDSAGSLRFKGRRNRLELLDGERTDGKQIQSIRELTPQSVGMLAACLGVPVPEPALQKPTRNPIWSRDELILALDLYFRHPPRQIHQDHPAVVELSTILNKLGSRLRRIQNGNFRNPNGVYMKLCNFLRFDPSYSGVGLSRGNQLEEEVWNQYADRRDDLSTVARAILAALDSDEEPRDPIDESDEAEFAEGSVLYRAHRRRERNRQLINKAKLKAKRRSPLLPCEVCEFSFVQRYGKVGEDYIECHHTVPISSMNPGDKTRLKDIALLCSNCHRMVHRQKNWLSIDALREIWRKGNRGHQTIRARSNGYDQFG